MKSAEHWIRVEDRITLPLGTGNDDKVTFRLHAGLALELRSDGFVLREKKDEGRFEHQGINADAETVRSRLPIKEYEITSDRGGALPEGPILLYYEGKIHHPIKSESEEYARSFNPWFGDGLVTFRMEIETPESRKTVTQGRRETEELQDGVRHAVWECAHPMDDIYLIEAPFEEYKKKVGEVTAFAFLRRPDQGLAGKYLDATAQYIEMYNDLIGPYPYSKFALVENFWETGYGMPSFTLLGPKIIRFPFILHSSYPHEILHNWWGNSVFVDYETGNWCEGLTAYLADHLIKEVRGQGEAYRRDTLQRYRNFVRKAKDFPLREFRARHDATTEAIGYGKSLMLFHMMRMRMGDELFRQGLKAFYERFAFKRAAFEDVEKVFSDACGEDLKPFFETWAERSGAPKIHVIDHSYDHSRGSGSHLTITLAQVQEEPVYPVRVPIAVYVQGKDKADLYTVDMQTRTEVFRLQIAEPILKVEVDPYFDLFRELDREEIPPTLGQAFGADEVLIIVPENEKASMRDAWRGLAETWGSDQTGKIEIRSDDEVDSLPAEKAVWVFGRENRWRPLPESGLHDYGVIVEAKRFTLPDSTLPFEDHCMVISLRHPANADQVLCWVTADLPDSLPGLGRKLPHYGKYSYLAFEGSEPTNVAKGQWPLNRSPMKVLLESKTDQPEDPGLPRRVALAEPPAPVDLDRLKAHVAFLADDHLKGRGLGTPELDEAAEYIARRFGEYGLKPGGETGSYFQAWQEKIEREEEPVLLKNVIAVIPGSDPKLKHEWVVVAAHYDHLGLGWPDVHEGDEGKIHNGADDNASGVAVLLELARMMGGGKSAPIHSIAFVAFTGEEAGLIGSRRFIAHAGPLLSGSVRSMVNLDSVGRLGERKLLVFGTHSAREWPFIMMGCGYVTGLSVENVQKDPGTGDQVAFLEAGIPAIHIFSGIHADYHRPGDDVEKIDFEGMAKIVEFTREAVVHLGDRTEPLEVRLEERATTEMKKPEHPGKKPAGKGRRASLGTMPDFAWSGEGVRIAAATEGSPAATAGLEEGDIILRIGERAIENLRGFSDALKAHQPGDCVKVEIKRGDELLSFEVTLAAR
ncbi:MAG: M28 family peptidase [Planctomycetota bacterium]